MHELIGFLLGLAMALGLTRSSGTYEARWSAEYVGIFVCVCTLAKVR